MAWTVGWRRSEKSDPKSARLDELGVRRCGLDAWRSQMGSGASSSGGGRITPDPIFPVSPAGIAVRNHSCRVSTAHSVTGAKPRPAHLTAVATHRLGERERAPGAVGMETTESGLETRRRCRACGGPSPPMGPGRPGARSRRDRGIGSSSPSRPRSASTITAVAVNDFRCSRLTPWPGSFAGVAAPS